MLTMRSLTLVWANLVGIAGPVGADDRSASLEVIEKAIRAHGGEEALKKALVQSRTATGILTLFGGEKPINDETVMSLPQRIRIKVEIDKRLQIITGINGKKGWQSSGGAAQELNPDVIAELREEMYVLWMDTLLPLRDPRFTLTPLADTKVGGQPASVIKVAAKNHADVRLAFDKNTGLLVKVSRKAKEAGLEVDKEYLYSDHKDYEGVKLPSRLVESLNGRKITEVTITAYKFPGKVDDATFNMP